MSALPAEEVIFDQDAFKQVMRSLAGTVAVISTEDEGRLYGFTATAVCSVCAEPPTILAIANRSTRTHAHIVRKGAYAVNLLASRQSSIAQIFGGKSDDQFASVPHVRAENGVPIILDSAGYLLCQVKQAYDVGTHTIFLGGVVEGHASGLPPLLYHEGRYGQVLPLVQ